MGAGIPDLSASDKGNAAPSEGKRKIPLQRVRSINADSGKITERRNDGGMFGYRRAYSRRASRVK
jgi:hypothetical protein